MSVKAAAARINILKISRNMYLCKVKTIYAAHLLYNASIWKLQNKHTYTQKIAALQQNSMSIRGAANLSAGLFLLRIELPELRTDEKMVLVDNFVDRISDYAGGAGSLESRDQRSLDFFVNDNL